MGRIGDLMGADQVTAGDDSEIDAPLTELLRLRDRYQPVDEHSPWERPERRFG